MNVTQEHDRVPGKGILVAMACLVAVSTIGVLGAYFLSDCSSAEFARALQPPLYVEQSPGPSPAPGPAPVSRSIPKPTPGVAPTPGAVPGQVPEEVNHIEQVLFADRAPGLEERAYERTLLRSYGWVSRDARLVRIPIERAIELYVQRSVQGQDLEEDQP